ncbi:MAG: Tetratricopeptide repeat protein [Spirochaetes bacterium ADurb.Bin110]|nr:MAG: Tetratricopeptide repeat protein [Spirochaetes bacterium ADurb.Bin110]
MDSNKANLDVILRIVVFVFALISISLFVIVNNPLYAQTNYVMREPSPPQNPAAVGKFQFGSPGILSKSQELLPGIPFPKGIMLPEVTAFFELRDNVYESATPESIEAQAVSLLKILSIQPISSSDQALLEARIAYLVGRSWNDHKDKKKAIAWFERAVEAAQKMISLEGETPTALVTLAEPLGELSILKDLGFLIKNGPKVGQYASKALELDPKNIKALILKASALAYPPPIWGGDYKKALEMYASVLSIAKNGLPKDVLFDLRVGIATAYSNLNLSENAAWWFDAALEIYPKNPYAKSELEKLL